jgi:hypothetical protein
MPYQHCPRCRLTCYSAARYSSQDSCPRCGTQLASEPRRFFSVTVASEKAQAALRDLRSRPT